MLKYHWTAILKINHVTKKVYKNCCGTLKVFVMSRDGIHLQRDMFKTRWREKCYSISWNLAVIISVDVIYTSPIIQNAYTLLPGAGLIPLPTAGPAVAEPKLWYAGVWIVSSEMPRDGEQGGCKPQTLPSVPAEGQVSWPLGSSSSQFAIKKWRYFFPLFPKELSQKEGSEPKPTQKPTIRIKNEFSSFFLKKKHHRSSRSSHYFLFFFLWSALIVSVVFWITGCVLPKNMSLVR